MKGIRNDLLHSGIIKGEEKEMVLASVENQECQDYMDEYVDDVNEKPLITSLVNKARGDEMDKFRQHNVYTKVTIAECVATTSK